MSAKFLMDTNALLWSLGNVDMLSEKAKKVLNEKNDIYYSDVSLWEIAIKISIGKLKIEGSISDIEDKCSQLKLIKLPILSKSFEVLRTLPFIHKDPFDRLIISQALINGYTLITSDTKIPKYPVSVVW